MRELKFRVWDKANNRYLRRDSTGIDNLGNIIDFENCDEDDWGVHNVRILGKNDMGFTTEQYTGLHDKNSKEIYEGDIVLIDMWDGNKRVPEIGHIAYDQSFAGFKWLSADGISGYCLYDMDYPIRKVIDDIHNNPELLER